MMMRTLLPALAAALLLSACGYKGDLYLPKENYEIGRASCRERV